MIASISSLSWWSKRSGWDRSKGGWSRTRRSTFSISSTRWRASDISGISTSSAFGIIGSICWSIGSRARCNTSDFTSVLPDRDRDLAASIAVDPSGAGRLRRSVQSRQGCWSHCRYLTGPGRASPWIFFRHCQEWEKWDLSWWWYIVFRSTVSSSQHRETEEVLFSKMEVLGNTAVNREQSGWTIYGFWTEVFRLLGSKLNFSTSLHRI